MKKVISKTSIVAQPQYEAESLEIKLERVKTSNEPIDATAPLIYYERKDGVAPESDIRTDRWEHALDAADKITKSRIAARQEKMTQENNTEGGE